MSNSTNLFVKITDGRYRNSPVNGVFKVVRALKTDQSGKSWITIWNESPIPGHPNQQRVTITVGQFQYMDSAGAEVADSLIPQNSPTVVTELDFEAAVAAAETEEDVRQRIAKSFEMLETVVSSVSKGQIRGLIVTGPAGIGKTHTITEVLHRESLFQYLKDGTQNYQVYSGTMSQIGLYQVLYNNRGPDQVLVLDDCDGAIYTPDSLNMLKAVLNSSKKRRVSYVKESRALARESIPTSFDFEGSVIFITNQDFRRLSDSDSRVAIDMKGLLSRCHYLDMHLSRNDVIVRANQLIDEGMLADYGFNDEEKADVKEFFNSNLDMLNEISIRIVSKIADTRSSMGARWREISETTLLNRRALFKRRHQELESKRNNPVTLLTHTESKDQNVEISKED